MTAGYAEAGDEGRRAEAALVEHIGTGLGLEDVAGPADRHAGIAVGEGVDVFRGMELGDRRTQQFQALFGFGDDRRIGVALGILDLDLQIGLTAQRFVAGVVIRCQLQQLAVVLQRLVRVGSDRLGADDRQLCLGRCLLTGDRADRRGSVLRGRCRAAGKEQRGDGRSQGRAQTKGPAQGRARHGASPFSC